MLFFFGSRAQALGLFWGFGASGLGFGAEVLRVWGPRLRDDMLERFKGFCCVLNFGGRFRV